MRMSTPLECLNLVPKRVRGEREAMDEEKSIFDVQAEEILKPKEEATKNRNEDWNVWMAHLYLYIRLGKYAWATPLIS